jgi:alpha,alpha-trehalase
MNFTPPTEGEKYVPPSGQSLRAHIDGLSGADAHH